MKVKISRLKDDLKFNYLVSYCYNIGQQDGIMALRDGVEEGKMDILLDSGAFTAYNTGKDIELMDYIRFLKDPPFKIWKYFTLDVVGKPKEYWINYYRMLDAGLNPIPIFTPGDSFDSIDKMYETSDLIGIGGLDFQGIKDHVKLCMQVIDGRKAHWLGFANFQFLKHYKPFSCDSSNIISGSKYGRLGLCRSNGKTIALTREDFIKKPSYKIVRLLEEYGVRLEDLKRKENWQQPINPPETGLMVYLAFMGMLRKSLLIQKHLGTRLFHVCHRHDLFWALKAFDFWVEKGI